MTGIAPTSIHPPPSANNPRPGQLLVFGNGTAKALAGAVDDALRQPKAMEQTIEGLNKSIERLFGPAKSERWGFTIEDWASRVNILVAGYIPQTFLAFYENAHKWETLGRNALIFALTVAVMAYSKSDTYSINTMVFDRFMKPERLGGNYFEALKAAGIPFKESDLKKAFWAKLDLNQVDHLEQLGFELNKALGGALEGKGKGADAERVKQLLRHVAQGSDEAALAEGKKLNTLIPKFIQRMNQFKIGSTALFSVLVAIIVGQLSMEFVWRFIAPFDKDFDKERYLAQKNRKNADDIFKKDVPQRLPTRLVRVHPEQPSHLSYPAYPANIPYPPSPVRSTYSGPAVFYAGQPQGNIGSRPLPPAPNHHWGGPA